MPIPSEKCWISEIMLVRNLEKKLREGEKNLPRFNKQFSNFIFFVCLLQLRFSTYSTVTSTGYHTYYLFILDTPRKFTARTISLSYEVWMYYTSCLTSTPKYTQRVIKFIQFIQASDLSTASTSIISSGCVPRLITPRSFCFLLRKSTLRQVRKVIRKRACAKKALMWKVGHLRCAHALSVFFYCFEK